MHLKTEGEATFEIVLCFNLSRWTLPEISAATLNARVLCGLVLLLNRLLLRVSAQPPAEPAVLKFVTHGMARRHSPFSRSLFVIILDRVACSGSRKCQVRTAHNTGKHKIGLHV